jgi:hypothetical protein
MALCNSFFFQAVGLLFLRSRLQWRNILPPVHLPSRTIALLYFTFSLVHQNTIAAYVFCTVFANVQSDLGLPYVFAAHILGSRMGLCWWWGGGGVVRGVKAISEKKRTADLCSGPPADAAPLCHYQTSLYTPLFAYTCLQHENYYTWYPTNSFSTVLYVCLKLFTNLCLLARNGFSVYTLLQCCGSGMFISDPGFEFFTSLNPDPNFSFPDPHQKI